MMTNEIQPPVSPEIQMASTEPAESPIVVVKILGRYRVAINRGETHGVILGQRYLIYALSEEVKDPVTGESLGQLELVRGTGKAVHVQQRMTIVDSDMQSRATRTIVRRRSPIGLGGFGTTEEETIEPSPEPEPFKDARVGDRVRPI